jgi:hypothetical protein
LLQQLTCRLLCFARQWQARLQMAIVV